MTNKWNIITVIEKNKIIINLIFIYKIIIIKLQKISKYHK